MAEDKTKDVLDEVTVDSMFEPDPPADTEQTTEVVTTDDVVDTGAVAAEVETPEADEKPAFDKVRQQVQQEISNKLRPVEAKLDALLSKIDQQGQATPAQREQVATLQDKVEAVKDELSEYETADLDSIDPNKAVKALTSRLRKMEAETRDYQQRYEAQARQIAESNRPAQELAYRSQWTTWFKAQNPDLRDKADDAFEAFSSELGSYVAPGEQLPPNTLKNLSGLAYQRAVERLKNTPVAATQPQTPPKSVKGTQTVPTGAPARKPIASNGKQPTYDQLVAGMFEDSDD